MNSRLVWSTEEDLVFRKEREKEKGEGGGRVGRKVGGRPKRKGEKNEQLGVDSLCPPLLARWTS